MIENFGFWGFIFLGISIIFGVIGIFCYPLVWISVMSFFTAMGLLIGAFVLLLKKS